MPWNWLVPIFLCEKCMSKTETRETKPKDQKSKVKTKSQLSRN